MTSPAPPRQLPLLDEDEHSQRLLADGEFRGVPSYVLDVPETIPQLGYGSHQFFRYYGKFPSVVGREIVARHASPGGGVLDCYAGSGTTLVEAQNRGLASFGLDLNPLAVLACRVKTGYHDAGELRAVRDRVLAAARDPRPAPALSMMSADKLAKWFSPQARGELAALRQALLDEPPGDARSFMVLAYLGIVRRVSTAYDGEVRPHVNPQKKPRSPVAAFAKKADEMIAALPEVDRLRPGGVPSRSAVSDNRDPASYRRVIAGAPRPTLVVAHPPYLNSFNYLSVFTLELAWSEGFDEVWEGFDLAGLRAREHRAWPATNEALKDAYYDDFRRVAAAVAQAGAAGGRFAVVIGDATIRGTLEPVHLRFWDVLEELGFTPLEVWFRTTHYGIGKYAYSHRADYHGEAEKRDAVLFFSLP